MHRSGAQTRTLIVAAAADAIARKGVGGLRVAEVARTANVATSLLYYHFSSRQALVRAALDQSLRPYAVGPAGRPAASGTRALRVALLQGFDDDDGVRTESVLRSEANASAVFDNALQPELRRHTLEWQDAVAELIRRGHADGSIAASIDPTTTARQLTSLVDGVRERWLADVVELARARSLVGMAVDALVAHAG